MTLCLQVLHLSLAEALAMLSRDYSAPDSDLVHSALVVTRESLRNLQQPDRKTILVFFASECDLDTSKAVGWLVLTPHGLPVTKGHVHRGRD